MINASKRSDRVLAFATNVFMPVVSDSDLPDGPSERVEHCEPRAAGDVLGLRIYVRDQALEVLRAREIGRFFDQREGDVGGEPVMTHRRDHPFAEAARAFGGYVDHPDRLADLAAGPIPSCGDVQGGIERQEALPVPGGP